MKSSPTSTESKVVHLHRQVQETLCQYLLIYLLLGVVLPILCLIFDPGIFHSAKGSGLLEGISWFIYTLALLQTLTMLVWLYRGEKLGSWSGYIAGVFLVGVGIALPFSPFLALFIFSGVYLRHGLLAFNLGWVSLPKRRFLFSFLTAAFLVIAIPISVQLYVYYLRPQIEVVQIYPNAEHIQVGKYELVDSGTAYMKVISFDTNATEKKIWLFYDRILSQRGWWRSKEEPQYYRYVSGSGREYVFSLEYEMRNYSVQHVTIHIRYANLWPF